MTALIGMPGYYIYYRVAPEHAAGLEPRVRAMQAALAAETGIAGRLMEKRDEPLLWMEVYERVTDAGSFEQSLARWVKEHRLAEGLQPGSQRRTECFLDGGR
ncbi:MAG TPA: DUF4936 family protein [Burkholderiales bacterium]|nr:DUF4936 family protein [Burkholderiales bacterium]